jgi:hypothetical protein
MPRVRISNGAATPKAARPYALIAIWPEPAEAYDTLVCSPCGKSAVDLSEHRDDRTPRSVTGVSRC